MKRFLTAVKKFGIVEASFIAISLLIKQLYSFTTCFFYNIRGYAIPFSTNIGPGVSMQRSTKGSIKIGEHTDIGDHAKLLSTDWGKITLGKHIQIGEYTHIRAADEVSIDDDTMMGP